jgi:hypothetical protein
MRKTFIIVALLFVGMSLFGRDETLDQLKARADKSDNPKLFVEVAQRELQLVSAAYDSSKYDEGRAALADVTAYAQKGVDVAISRRKDMKHVEIALRKMAAHLEGIARSADFDHRAAVQDAIDKLQQGRTALLNAMFEKK